MARTALVVGGAIVGGVIGYFAGNPVLGAYIGAAVGGLVGALAFPESGPDVTNIGPRLDEQRFMTSQVGNPINRAFGAYRLAGNVIWTNGIEEVKSVTKEEVGGKGLGGGQEITTVTFNYFASFAVAFAVGPAATLRKIYMDNKLMVDQTGSGFVQKCAINYRFYLGDETQLPDSLLEAEEGVGNVSAHRGLVYIVFERLPIQQFGNRIPSVQAEITFDGLVDPVDTTTLVTAAVGADPNWMWDPARERAYFSHTKAPSYIETINLRTGEFENQVSIGDGSWSQGNQGRSAGFVVPAGFPLAGMLYIYELSTFDPQYRVVDPDTGTELKSGTYDTSSGQIIHSDWIVWRDFNMQTMMIEEKLYVLDYFAAATSAFAMHAIDEELQEQLPIPTGLTDSLLGVTGTDVRTSVHLSPKLLCLAMAGNDNSYLVFMETQTGQAEPKDGSSVPIIKTKVIDVTSQITDLNDLFYIRAEHALVGVTSSTGVSEDIEEGGEGFIKWFLAGQEAEQMSVTFAQKIDESTTGVSGSQIITSNELVSFQSQQEVQALTGEIDVYLHDAAEDNLDRLKITGTMEWFPDEVDLTDFDSGGSLSNLFYNPLTGAIHGSNTGLMTDNRQTVYLGRSIVGSTTLGFVVEELCTDVGLLSTEIDRSDLNSETIIGIGYGSQTTARRAIETLAQAHNFDGVESDYVLKFLFKGGSVVRAITEDDLGAAVDNPRDQIVKESRVEERTLPTRLDFTYVDFDDDFQPGNQAVTAPNTPDPVNFSTSKKQITTAEVFTANEAKQVVERIFYRSWAERSSYEVSVLPKHLDLDASDVITLTYDLGFGESTNRSRIVKVDLGGPFTVDWTSVSDQASVFTITNNSGASSLSGLTNQAISVASMFDLFVVDTPYFRDADYDQDSRTGKYFAVCAISPNDFVSALIFASADQVEWEQLLFTTRQTEWGIAETTLATTGNWASKDEVNTLTIQMKNGGLVSDTETNVMDGANALWTESGEVIQFIDAVDNGDGNYTISNLFRARRGTSFALEDHFTGERIIALPVNGSTWNRKTFAVSIIGSEAWLKPLPLHQSFDLAAVIQHISVGNDLKCLEPVSVEGERDGTDLVVRWVRQTRGPDTTSNIDRDDRTIAPLGEPEEKYECDLNDATDGTARSTYINNEDINPPAQTATMTLTDNGDGTATITATGTTFTDWQRYQWIRMEGWTDADNNTHVVIDTIGSDTSVTVRLQDGTNDTNQPNVILTPLPTWAKFTATQQTDAGWTTTGGVQVTVYQLNAVIGRGFPSLNDTIPEGL